MRRQLVLSTYLAALGRYTVILLQCLYCVDV